MKDRARMILISRYIDGEASDEERNLVEGLIRSDADFARDFAELKELCHTLDTAAHEIETNGDLVERIMRKLSS